MSVAEGATSQLAGAEPAPSTQTSPTSLQIWILLQNQQKRHVVSLNMDGTTDVSAIILTDADYLSEYSVQARKTRVLLWMLCQSL